MVDSGTLLDEGMIYFDARLSRHYPTVEIRVADVCLFADDAVLVAALARALVETAAAEWRAGEPPGGVRVEVLRLAGWRAARSGLAAQLVDPAGRAAAAAHVARALLAYVRPVLQRQNELVAVERLLDAVLERGNGADAQRRQYANDGKLADVVGYAVEQTIGS